MGKETLHLAQGLGSPWQPGRAGRADGRGRRGPVPPGVGVPTSALAVESSLGHPCGAR